MTPFLLMWLAQIAFGAVVHFTNPKRADLGSKAQSARTIAVFGGLVPCVGIMLLYQIFSLVMYRGLAAHAQVNRSKLQPRLPTSFNSSTPPEPPRDDDGETPSKRPDARSDNPFL